MVLTYDGLVKVLGVKAYPQLAVSLLGISKAADPWCGLSLFGDDPLMDHLCQLLLDLLLVLDGHLPSAVLDWWDCRVDLDVILTLHVTDAVEAVGVQHLEVPGTVDGH